MLHRFTDVSVFFPCVFQPHLTAAPSISFNFPCFLDEVTNNESVLKVLGGMVMSCYAKYWIYVCGGMFITVSFAGKLVGYKIVYMLLFLMCLCLYQVGSDRLFKFEVLTSKQFHFDV